VWVLLLLASRGSSDSVLATADNVGDDCPVFDGLFDYCALSAGSSMGQPAAMLLA
jgi:hypothetical protein